MDAMKRVRRVTAIIGFGFLAVLSGCRLDLSIVGDGAVTVTNVVTLKSFMTCTDSCRNTVPYGIKFVELEAEAKPGSTFLGFVKDLPDTFEGDIKEAQAQPFTNPVLEGFYGFSYSDEAQRWSSLDLIVKALFHETTDITDYVSDDTSFCMVSRSTGLECWGGTWSFDYAWKTITDIPEGFEHPQKVVISSNNGCALSDQQIGCWGSWNFDFSELSNPVELAGSDNIVCAHNGIEVQCFGQYALPLNVPTSIVGPQTLVAESLYACVVAQSGIHCWGEGDELTLTDFAAADVSGLAMDRVIWAPLDEVTICALVGDEVSCRGTYAETIENHPTLTNPTSLTIYHDNACALDDSGIRCWGNRPGIAEVPSLENVTQLKFINHLPCAFGSQGMICWGE